MPERPTAAPARRAVLVTAVAAAVVVAAVIVTVGVTWLVRPTAGPDPQGAAQRPTTVTGQGQPPTPPSPRPFCDTATHGFAPRTITVPGVTTGASVVTPPRDANGVPGVPPLTSAGKHLFAWDREQGIRPGDPAGNVLLNVHAWPDGSALGNQLLAALHRGDRIVVSGADGARLCYRVTERVEVLAERGMPRYYRTDGPPRLAILTCSGRRLGPGVWEKRTVWFAAPSLS